MENWIREEADLLDIKCSKEEKIKILTNSRRGTF